MTNQTTMKKIKKSRNSLDIGNCLLAGKAGILGIPKNDKVNWLLIPVLVLAAFLRFFKLSSLPPGLHPDEAANGLDVISMFDAHKFQAIYDTNGPREALFLYLQAIPVWIGKITGWAFLNFTPLSLRIAPAIIGVATVYGIYLLGKELFNRNVGLFAAAALAVSAWHIQFSRNGFRAIMAPLALVFLFYFLIRAYRNGRLKDYIATGITLALGFYTYLSFRMVPLVLFALIGYILIFDRGFILTSHPERLPDKDESRDPLKSGGKIKEKRFLCSLFYSVDRNDKKERIHLNKNNLKKIGILILAAFIVMIPMLVHFVHVPADIAGRSSTSIFNPETNGGSAVGALGSNIIKTLEMFNIKGDQNFRHNVAGSPMLDPFIGILLWVGAILTLIRIRKFEYFLLVMWAGALSLPEILTSEGIPHALRIVGIIPVVFLLAAIGLDWLLCLLCHSRGGGNPVKEMVANKTLIIGLTLILIISGTLGFYKYFVQFPSYSEAREAYAENMVGIANDIKKQDSNTKLILIAGEYGTKTVQFMIHPAKKTYDRYETYTIKYLKLPNQPYKIYVEREWKDETEKELRKIGFTGDLKPVYSPADGRVIYFEYTSVIPSDSTE